MIGFNPAAVISAKGNILSINGRNYKRQNPYYALREIMPQQVLTQSFSGGLAGYISYEAVNYLEPGLKLKEHQSFKQFRFGVYTDGLLLDKVTGETSYFFNNRSRLPYLKELLKRRSYAAASKSTIVELGPNISKNEHRQLVNEILNEIRAGNTFQCEVGVKFNYRVRGRVLPVYAELRKVNPSPYMFYLKFDKEIILGSSPELLFALKQKQMQTFPLAGTIGRGKNRKADIELARKLLNDPKEQAEHKMLVDLHRNDLGRVAKFGSVSVSRFMDIKKFSHVQHISSEISGIIKPGEDQFSALASCFPAGTLTGAPKIESMKIISRQEKEARGPYGGAVGFFGFNGDCEFAIPIRSMFVYGSKAYTQACGGVVYDSKPDREYQEIINKLKAFAKVLKKFK